MGDIRTHFYFSELSKCVAWNKQIGQFVPVSGIFILKTPGRKYKPLSFYLAYFAGVGSEVSYGFEEDYAEIINDTLAEVDRFERIQSNPELGDDPEI